MSFRRAAKVDTNQPQIVRELRAQGFKVDITSQLKKLYDLVVTGKVYGTNDIRTVRVEVKSEGGTLTPDEAEYHRNDPYPETLIIAFTSEDVLEWFNKPYLKKKNLLESAVISASVDVVSVAKMPITPSFTTSKRKGGQSIRNSTTRETLS
jgi:hypothetical protein